MLVSLADMKTHLGITDATYDTFLNTQLTEVSDIVENYCGRVFSEASYIQTFYRDDFDDQKPRTIPLFHYPLTTLTYVKEGSETSGVFTENTEITTDIRQQKPLGKITLPEGFFGYDEVLQVSYDAGYATIPSAIQVAVKSIVEEKYNKYVSGVGLNFGSDVQSIAIPGTISVTFDYTLQQNQRSNAYGTVIGAYTNILDQWRSSRTVVGQGRITYVE